MVLETDVVAFQIPKSVPVLVLRYQVLTQQPNDTLHRTAVFTYNYISTYFVENKPTVIKQMQSGVVYCLTHN